MLTEKAMTGRASINDRFDVTKAIATVGYLVQRTGASMYAVMKMLYLADKMHLDRYGRFIAGDHYVAMKQGPVPSCTYRMIRHIRGEESGHPEYLVASDYFAYRIEKGDHIIDLLRNPDVDELSESDTECLDEIAEIYNKMGKWAVRAMSHDAAWTAGWNSKKRRFFQRQSAPMPIEDIVGELDNGSSLLEHIRDRSPGEA